VKKVLVALLAIGLMAAAAWAQTDTMLGPHNTNSTFGCQSCHAPHSQVVAGTGNYMWGLSVPTNTYNTYSVNATIGGTGAIPANTVTTGTAPTSTAVFTVLCLSCHDTAFNAVMAGGQTYSPTVNMSTPISNFTGSGDGAFTSITGGVIGPAGEGDLTHNHPVHVLYPNLNGSAASGYTSDVAFKYWAVNPALATPSTPPPGMPKGVVPFKDAGGTIFTYGHNVVPISFDTTTAYVECITCHDPHSQNVSVVWNHATNTPTATVATAHFLRGEYDNTQTQAAFCMSCHADKSLAWNGTGAQ